MPVKLDYVNICTHPVLYVYVRARAPRSERAVFPFTGTLGGKNTITVRSVFFLLQGVEGFL